MSETVVSIQQAKIYQGNNLILDDVNFTVQKGEFVYLVGKTGTMATIFDVPISRPTIKFLSSLTLLMTYSLRVDARLMSLLLITCS